MNVFEDLVVELKEENLLEETVIDCAEGVAVDIENRNGNGKGNSNSNGNGNGKGSSGIALEALSGANSDDEKPETSFDLPLDLTETDFTLNEPPKAHQSR